MLQTVARPWTRRRLAVLVTATPLLAAGYLRASGVPSADLPVAWLALALVAAVLGAAVLASYVPATGWRPDLGCSPCAAVAGLSLVGSVIAIGSYGPTPVGPALAAAITLYGLTQRLGPASCATPRRGASAKPAPGVARRPS
jgi:peptidoglycan/LPS O-acetylase OafA/YrhL